jgi:2-phosphosulfolactate phosphatase
VYGISNGAKEIIPVATVDSCLEYKGSDYLLAAERDGEIVPGFDFGNSPYAYTKEKVEGKKIVLTTTNGTHAIELSKGAPELIIGSFLNLKAISNYLLSQHRDVLLLCAGWKNKFNLEDTLFAGAVVNQIKSEFGPLCDSAIAAEELYLLAKSDLRGFLKKSSHTSRLEKLGIEKDVLFCLQIDIVNTIPKLLKNKIVDLKQI